LAKNLYIKTYGCQMNVYDSERMTDILTPLGYRPIETPNDADLVILNTCHIREKAAEKVYSDLGRIRILKEKREDPMMVAVAGCVGQAEGDEIFKRAPIVDMVFGPQTYHRLPELIARAERANGGVLDTDFPVEDKFDALPKISSEKGPTAFLTIQEGCDKFCTFCVVPYTRGAEFSRSVKSIEEEARGLIQNGVREITLLGQNVNAYHGESPHTDIWSLGRLIKHLAEIDGLDRIRYMTSHPRDMDRELIDAHRDVPQLMPYLHLPVQSGSDSILAAMNRGHTAKEYLTLIEEIRAVRGDIALSSDFIVGFPGETEKDFNATMELVKAVRYSQAFSFKYSARPGTPGATMFGHVSEQEKSDRLGILQNTLSDHQDSFNAACFEREMPVLLQSTGRHTGQLIGRSPYLQPVHVDADPTQIGDIVQVRITEVMANSLAGEIAPSIG
jgi:tRNA-2-methylthio-N6-dimethylallyladenosine synthase